MDKFLPHVRLVYETLDSLPRIAEQGQYEQVFPRDDPTLVDEVLIKMRGKTSQELEIWKFYSEGDRWEYKNGVLMLITNLLPSLNSESDVIQRKIGDFAHDICKIHN